MTHHNPYDNTNPAYRLTEDLFMGAVDKSDSLLWYEIRTGLEVV